MDKLLIVDDDYLVREGLRMAIDWQSVGVEVVGTAENGGEGLEKARELCPDLIIADVRMPGIDGLQMAKTLFDEGADLAVIVYSGYKDFENARRALDSGVAGFLLKPIEEGELLTRVKEVLARLHEKRKESAMLGQFITNIPLVKKQQFELLLKDGEGEEAAAEQLRLLGSCPPAAGTVIYVTSNNPSELSAFAERVLAALAPAYSVWEELSGKAVIITSAAQDEAAGRINSLLASSLKISDARFTVSACAFSGSVGAAYRKAQSLNESSVFAAVNTVITEAGNASIKKLVRDALAVIERDYNKKISVRSVAYELYTSESHLMHEFKSQLGKTFNEVLTEYRMQKAQELLIKGDMRVGEVAYAVGYNDVKYFSQVFRDYLGCTPSEFSEQRRQ